MKNLVNSRLEQFIAQTQKSKRDFERVLNVANGTISNALKTNRSIGSDILYNIFYNFPELNSEWLYKGSGEMLLEDKTVTQNVTFPPETVTQTVTPVAILSQSPPKSVAILSQSPEWLSSSTKPHPKNINTDITLSSEVALQVLEDEGLRGRRVYISPEPAMASYPSSYTGEGGGGLEYFYMPFLSTKGLYACFLVQGKSMEEYILEGSWVICRLLEEQSQIRSGNLHLIATQSEGLLLKRVRKEPKIKNKGIICYSDNAQYLPFIVPHEDIIKVWVVEMFLQKEFPFLSERANKNLENFLDEL